MTAIDPLAFAGNSDSEKFADVYRLTEDEVDLVMQAADSRFSDDPDDPAAGPAVKREDAFRDELLKACRLPAEVM